MKFFLVSYSLTVEDLRGGVGFGCISGTHFWDPESVCFSRQGKARHWQWQGKLSASRPSDADGETISPGLTQSSHGTIGELSATRPSNAEKHVKPSRLATGPQYNVTVVFASTCAPDARATKPPEA